jgi:hypothetical protein
MEIVLAELGIPLFVLSLTGPLAVSIFIVLTKTGNRLLQLSALSCHEPVHANEVPALSRGNE